MDKLFLKEIFNVPFRKCRILREYYPISFMIKLISIQDCEKLYYIPDCLFSEVFIIQTV